MAQERKGWTTVRKVICSLGVGPHQELLDIARPAIEDYASRHGYDLRLFKHETVASPWPERVSRRLGLKYERPFDRRLRNLMLKLDAGAISRFVDTPRPVAWMKVRVIRTLLGEYDAVFWIDADAIIVDASVDIAGEIAPGKWLYAVVTQTPGDTHLNSGVLLVCPHPDALRFLDDVWRQRDLIYHRWWEQAAVLRVLGYQLDPVLKERDSEYDRGLKIIDDRWNSIPTAPVAAPYIKHYAGVSHAERLACMRADAEATIALRSATDGARSASRDESGPWKS